MASDTTPYLRVHIGDGDVSTLVWHVDVEDTDRGSDKATLMMDDQGSTSSDAVRIEREQPVRIELGWETEHSLIFEGQIHQIQPSANGTTQHTRLVAYDKSATMTQGVAQHSGHHAGTLTEILTTILERYAIPIGKVEIDPMPSWPEEEPLLQPAHQNDWQFIQDLAVQHHARAFVEVNVTEDDDDATRERGGSSKFYFMSERALVAQDPLGKLMYCRGMGRLLEFKYRRTASGAWPQTATTTVDPGTGEAQTHQGEPAPPEDAPDSNTRRAGRVAAVRGEGSARAYEGATQAAAAAPLRPDAQRASNVVTGLPSSPTAAARLIESDPTRQLGMFGEGLAMGSVFLRAKGPVEIEGLASWAKGRWYITRVNHLVQRQRVNTDTQLTFRSQFTATR